MKNKVLLYFLSVGMISGWAVNDGNAMNMQNLPPMMPLQPVQPTKHQAIQPIQPMQSSQQTQVGKGKKKRRGQQNQMQQGIPQAKPTMPTMPSVQQAKPTMPSMPQVKQPEVTKPLTAEDRFKQRVREMMKSGSTELVIDEDYLGLNSEQYKDSSGSYIYQNIKSITADAEIANYIREKVKTLVVNSGTINIALEEMRSSTEAQHNKLPIWFNGLEHVILCNGSKINVGRANVKDRYDVTVKGALIDFYLRLPGMRKLYWWPDFGKYDVKDRSLELTSADQVKRLMTQFYNGNTNSTLFSKITFPKNAEINFNVFNLCNTIAVDCQSTKFLLSYPYYDYNRKTKIIMNGVQFVTKNMQSDIIHKLMYGADFLAGEDLAKRKQIHKNTEFVWPKVKVLEQPDFTEADALLLTQKAKLNSSDNIYIKEGVKWIGEKAFSSSTKFTNNFSFNLIIPDSVIDIDKRAFSNNCIKDIIVKTERVKRLVQDSGFQKNIIVDANAKQVLSKDEQINELQQELIDTKKMLTLANRRLENLEIFLMSVCEFEPFYDYLSHYSFKTGKTYTGPQQWFKSYKKFNPHLNWPNEDNEPYLDSVTYAEDNTDNE